MSNRRAADMLEIPNFKIELEPGPSPKNWRPLGASTFSSVEKAVLAQLESEGWRGYWGEVGLIANLIKAMSVPKLPPAHRAIPLIGLYSPNVLFDEAPYEVGELLANVGKATSAQIEQNYRIMASREPFVRGGRGWTITSTASMLDDCPGLELWMFLELHAGLGNERLRSVAEILASEPDTLFCGWPDLTVWNRETVRFIEVKAPGDTLRATQKKVIERIFKPLSLDVAVVDVIPARGITRFHPTGPPQADESREEAE